MICGGHKKKGFKEAIRSDSKYQSIFEQMMNEEVEVDPNQQDQQQFQKKEEEKKESFFTKYMNKAKENFNKAKENISKETKKFKENYMQFGKEEQVKIDKMEITFKKEEQHLLSLEGTLLKKNKFTWSKVKCELINKQFKFCKINKDQRLEGFIDFDIVCINLSTQKDQKTQQIKSFTLQPKEQQKKFIFKRENPNQNLEEWVETLTQHIGVSLGFTQKLLFSVPYFWKHLMITVDKFMMEADCLDILLFRTDSAPAILQRNIAQSQFDHAAFVIRINDEIFITEATGNEGVSMCSWKDFMKYDTQQYYEKIVYRRLICERSNEFKNNLGAFVTNVLGNSYGLSPSKLLKFKSMVNDPQADKNRTFFCSELVAAAYKKVNLLPKEISASQYWPGSFAQDSNINSYLKKVNPQNYLGQEQLICFARK